MPTRAQVLRAVYQLQQASGAGIARTTELADRLGVNASSASAWVQELAAAALVRYTPRKGAILTAAGRRQAEVSIRRLRVIERFLGNVLGVPPDVVATEAESLDRYVSERVLSAIAGFSGQPQSIRK